jgi:hypothetical protein
MPGSVLLRFRLLAHARTAWGQSRPGPTAHADPRSLVLPPRLVLDRNRGGAYLAVLLIGAAQ